MYIPNENDIRWLRQVINTINEGGSLMMPDAKLHYRVSHKEKKFTLLNPEQLIHPESLRTHLRQIAVAGFCDYSVEEDEVTRAATLFEKHLEECPICTLAGPIMCINGLYIMDVLYQALIKAAQESGRAAAKAEAEAERKKKAREGNGGSQ
jgi:hypothetical protein